MAEPLAGEADDGRIDQRHHLLDMVQQQTVEQGLVLVLQLPEKNVFLEIAALIAKRLVASRSTCSCQGSTCGGSSPSNPIRFSFLFVICRPLVQQWVVDALCRLVAWIASSLG